MEREDLTILRAARSLRLSPWRGYSAAAGVYCLATGMVFLALQIREAPFICYLPAIMLATLVGGGHAGLWVAIGGGLATWFWLYPVASSQDAMALMLYVDAAAILLLVTELLNRAIEALIRERDRARLLFAEAQHRTANNLMFISGFLRGHRREAQKDATKATASLDQALRQLDSYSSIHRELSSLVGTHVPLPILLQRLCGSLIEAAGARNVTVSMEIAPLEISPEEATLLSLFVMEVITNALKHAFGGRESGVIFIRLSSNERHHILELRDNGSGLHEDAGVIAEGTGYKILGMLAAQLGGTLVHTSEDGLRTRLVFPHRQSNGRAGFAGVLANAM